MRYNGSLSHLFLNARSAFLLAVSIITSLPLASQPASVAQTESFKGAINVEIRRIEAMVFEMLNRERRKAGRNHLKLDAPLTSLARRHSLDMATRGYLSHTNPSGDGPTQRGQKAGLTVTRSKRGETRTGISENIGLMPTGYVKGHGWVRTADDVARAMMRDWMNSPAHRSNILDTSSEAVGVGVAADGKGVFYMTLDFL